MKTNQKQKLFARFLAGVASTEEEHKLLDTSEVKSMMQEQWDNPQADNPQLDQSNLYRILANIYRRIASNKPKVDALAKVRRMVYVQISRAAAVILVMLSLGYLAWNIGLFGLNSLVTVSASEGVRSEIFLPDGSRVWLNSGGTIAYKKSFDDRNRKLKLSGEAYFNISTDPSRPFSVITDVATIQVTGTRFHVITESHNDVWETTLLEGSISVYPTNNEKQIATNLIPGQKATWDVCSKNFIVNEVNTSKHVLGFTNQLRFDNEPLGSLANQLEKTFGVRIDVPPALAQKYRFTATFSDESIFEIFNLLKITAPIDFTLQGNRVVVSQGTDK